MDDNLREIVNGAMLPQFKGKKVSITGLVTNINPNGLTFDMRATDDVMVKVTLTKPYRNALKGHVEVRGTANAGNTVICDDFMHFPSDDNLEVFDASSHNKLCSLLQAVPDLYK